MNNMNDMNELETQLRSWVPRRPSARLEQRWVGSQRASAVAIAAPDSLEEQAPVFRFRWLVPATAALILLCVLFNQREGYGVGGSTNSSPLVAMILSNHSVAAYLPGTEAREQNRPPADTFEWTNGSGSTSSIRSLSGPRARN
jgi:hypothetical protein